jgi:UDP-N-acetylglucosamine acyltransferase
MTNIHPSAVVHKKADLAPDVVVGPYCVIGAGARLGAGSRLHAGVVIGAGVVLGENNELHAHCVIGDMPQILGWQEGATYGGLEIGDHNVLREFVTIHCSMHEGHFTRIGSHNLIMVSAHVGHDCLLSDNLVISNGCQISGHCKIDEGAWLSGMVGVHQFVTIHKWAYAAGMTTITHDVPPFLVVSGSYPTRIRGVNGRGVRRSGLDQAAEDRIGVAYKRLYRQGDTLLENVRLMAAEDDIDENVQAMLTAIERSNLHRFGRYLETMR